MLQHRHRLIHVSHQMNVIETMSQIQTDQKMSCMEHFDMDVTTIDKVTRNALHILHVMSPFASQTKNG